MDATKSKSLSERANKEGDSHKPKKQKIDDTTGEPPKSEDSDLQGSTARACRDPMTTMLSQEMCLHIFSFLCEKPETFKKGPTTVLTRQEWLSNVAGKLHAQLRSVSRAWKAVFDGIAWADWVGVVEVDLSVNDPSKPYKSMMSWLCRYKVQLGFLNVFDIDLPLCTKLITECETTGLQDLGLKSPCVHKSNPTAQKNLHDTIAENCPNLRRLQISLELPQNTPVYSDYISTALFSHPSIRVLHLWIGYSNEMGPTTVDTKWGTETPMDGLVFTKLIQNLPKIYSLGLSALNPNDNLCKNRRFHIESNILALLAVEQLWNGAVVSLDCPSLEEFECDGGPSGNGLLPTQLWDAMYQVLLNVAVECDEDDEPFAALASKPFLASPLLQVPEECQIKFHNFQNWGEHGLEELTQRSNEFANATLWTFEEEIA